MATGARERAGVRRYRVVGACARRQGRSDPDRYRYIDRTLRRLFLSQGPDTGPICGRRSGSEKGEAAERMAQNGVGRLPIVSPDDPQRVIGIVTRSDLLKPRARLAEEEMRRERFIGRGPA